MCGANTNCKEITIKSVGNNNGCYLQRSGCDYENNNSANNYDSYSIAPPSSNAIICAYIEAAVEISALSYENTNSLR